MKGRGRQSATPTPPPRSPVPTNDVGDLGGGGRGHRYPWRTPTTSVEGSGSPILNRPRTPSISIFFIGLK
ncbi:hypothetical protein CRG98_032644 [Punica granatum]|uniref:Uncharacterized protein n=1 Tax=Punica granatum TaxID=22663 RepID=A0A2I0ISH0_PUNGR|nr:hypothetical protein CRG98_032644 [Punica granatum]